MSDGYSAYNKPNDKNLTDFFLQKSLSPSPAFKICVNCNIQQYLNWTQLPSSQTSSSSCFGECIWLFRKTRNHLRLLLFDHQPRPQVKKSCVLQALNVSFKHILVFLFWFSIYSFFSIIKIIELHYLKFKLEGEKIFTTWQNRLLAFDIFLCVLKSAF